MVFINGHGETTIVKGWEEIARQMVDGFSVGITTNFSKELSAGEIAVLARFKMITISLDTVDPSLLEKIRRGVNLANVKMNIKRVREAARSLGMDGPDFILSVGLFDRTVFKLRSLVWFAIRQRFKHVVFWNYHKYPDLPDAENVYPLRDLPDDELRSALRVVKRYVRLLRLAHIGVEVAGDFISELSHSVSSPRKELHQLREAQ